MKNLYGISGKEEHLALKQLAVEEKRKADWLCNLAYGYFEKRNKMTEQEKEDLAQEIGEI